MVLICLPVFEPLRPYLPWSDLVNVVLRSKLPEGLRIPLLDFALPVFVARELAWYFFNAQYLIIVYFDLFASYKNPQKERQPFEVQWFVFDAMNLDHITITPVFLAVCALSYKALPISVDWHHVPSAWEILVQIMVARVIREFLRYWVHRGMHMAPYYKWIHKKHHEYKYPFSLVGEYAHPLDNLFHGVIPIIFGLAAVSVMFGLHIVTIFADIYYATQLSVEEHAGYTLPWNADYWPFLSWINGGSLHHDKHHRDLNGNYGERWLDSLFGTTFENIRSIRQESLQKQA
jgi:methylsterol monooxygenase